MLFLTCCWLPGRARTVWDVLAVIWLLYAARISGRVEEVKGIRPTDSSTVTLSKTQGIQEDVISSCASITSRWTLLTPCIESKRQATEMAGHPLMKT